MRRDPAYLVHPADPSAEMDAVRPGAPGAGVRALASAVPVWAWLAGIVLASVAIRVALARQVVAPWIMVDELIYSELAKSFAAHGGFLVRGVPSHGYGFVYPVLIAPAWRLFASIPSAYAAAKDIDCVLMSLAALPAYGLARRLLPRGLSLVAAALAVGIPSLLYTGMLMTENVFYPLFLVVCYVLVLTLERPTWRRQIGLLVLCAVAYATRAQAVALFAAVLVAPVLHGWIERDLRSRLRRYLPLYGVVGVGVVLALLATAARGRSPLSLLGAYRAATGEGYSATTVLHYLLWHVAELDLYVGIVPFAALLALWLAPRVASPGGRAFAAATLPVSVLLVVEVAAFASTESHRIEERNMFYLAPFALISLLGLAVDGALPRVRRPLLLGALAAGVLPVAIPFGRFVNTSAVSDTFALLPWWWLQDQGIHFDTIRWVALAAGLAAAALLVALVVAPPRRLVLVLPALVLCYFGLTTAVVQNGRHGIRETAQGVLWAGIKKAHPDWIDRAVGHDANVAVLWTPSLEPHPVYDTEFFNRSVGTIYSIGADPWMGGLPETTVRVRANGRVTAPPVRYALSTTDIAGTEIASDPRIGFGLYRVNGPLVVLTRVRGLYAHDTWAGRHVSYRRLRCTGGTLSVLLQTDGSLYRRDQTVVAREAGRVVGRAVVPPTEQATLTVPLHPVGGVCRVDFTAARALVPHGDPRPLAAHYLGFDYRP